MNINNSNNYKRCRTPIVYPDFYSVVVVQNITERNNISCKLRQNGMIVIVVEEGYAQYQIQSTLDVSPCNNDSWVEIDYSLPIVGEDRNFIILNTLAEYTNYINSPFKKTVQLVYYVADQKYYKYNGIALVDPFPNKLEVPTETISEATTQNIPVYENGTKAWLPVSTLGKVESVNNIQVTPGTKNISLTTSDIPNTSDYATNTGVVTQIQVETDTRALADNNLAQSISDLNTLVNTINSWKTQMTTADSDSIINTVTELVAAMQALPEGSDLGALLNSKVNTSSIVDNLTSVLTNVPLSAYQGQVLKGLIDGLQTSFSLHSTNPNNPHSVTKSQVGLSNVDNTSDADKPVSTQQQLAFDAKIDKGSLVSNDESIFIDGVNLEGMLSLYKEEFSTQNKNLDFKPINFIGVYKNGLFLSVDDYTYTTPRDFSINEFQAGDKIIVQYQHLKTDTLL